MTSSPPPASEPPNHAAAADATSVLIVDDEEPNRTSLEKIFRREQMRVLVADRALPQGDPTSLPALPPAQLPDDQPVRWLFATSPGRHEYAGRALLATRNDPRTGIANGDAGITVNQPVDGAPRVSVARRPARRSGATPPA